MDIYFRAKQYTNKNLTKPPERRRNILNSEIFKINENLF